MDLKQKLKTSEEKTRRTSVGRTATIAGLVVASLLMPAKKSQAEVQGNIEALLSGKTQTSYARTNMFYELPGGINGYTFLEFYTQKQGMFGKSMLAKPITKGIAIKGEAYHCNEAFTNADFGVEATLPTPKGTTIQIKALPLSIDKNGNIIDHRVTGGYFASADLGKGWTVSSFGEANLAAKGGPEWNYGEFSIQKSLWDGVSIGYTPALKNKGYGKIVPKVEHRVSLTVNW